MLYYGLKDPQCSPLLMGPSSFKSWLQSAALTQEQFWSWGTFNNVWSHLFFCSYKWGWKVQLLASSGQRPAMLPNILQHARQSPKQRNVWPKMSVVLKLRNLGLNAFPQRGLPWPSLSQAGSSSIVLPITNHSLSMRFCCLHTWMLHQVRDQVCLVQFCCWIRHLT